MRFPAVLSLFVFLALGLSSSFATAQTILVFGDSLSAAYGIPRDSGWVALLQQARPGHKVINASISGETTSGGLRRFDAALMQHKPNIVVLELGANDGLRGAGIPAIEANLSLLLRKSRSHRAQVVLVGMQLPPNYGPDYTRDFRALYPKLAQRYHAALVPFLLAGVQSEQFQADNLHPVAAAQPTILNNILPALDPLLAH
jgi:acyl-CoA thioesterase-1